MWQRVLDLRSPCRETRFAKLWCSSHPASRPNQVCLLLNCDKNDPAHHWGRCPTSFGSRVDKRQCFWGFPERCVSRKICVIFCRTGGPYGKTKTQTHNAKTKTFTLLTQRWGAPYRLRCKRCQRQGSETALKLRGDGWFSDGFRTRRLSHLENSSLLSNCQCTDDRDAS